MEKNVNWKLYEGTKEGRHAKRSMKSFESFWELLDKEGYTLLSLYKKANDKVALKCPHGHVFEIIPNNFKSHGTRCPICQGLSKEHAKQEFEKLVKDEGYELLTPYNGAMKKVKMRCPHGHIFDTTPNSFKNQGSRCPICIEENIKLEFENLVKQEGYTLLTPYKGVMKKVKMRCPQGHVFEMTPNNFKNNGRRCPICSGSYGERTTYDYLTNLGLDFEIQKTFEGLRGVNGGVLRYDFYIPSLNLLLEINGVQHYESVGLWGGEERLLIQMENDNRKKAFARAMGINLVEIRCYSEREVDKLREKLDKVINEYIYKFFSFKAS